MLRLFKSLFSSGAGLTETYSESLIQEAIQRTVDATDSRLRALPGFEKRLRPAVITAIDHVVAMVTSMPRSVDASRAGYAGEPRLRAHLASADRMLDVFGDDPALLAARRDGTLAGSEAVFALLVSGMRERETFGMELRNDTLQREVLQHVVDFPEPRLADPTADEEQTRRLLMRRAFDHLLELALGRIVATSEARDGLERERRLLRRKLNAIGSGGWGFHASATTATVDVAGLEGKLDELEGQLREVGADGAALEVHLALVCKVLANPAENLWKTQRSVILDRMGVKRERMGTDTSELVFDELHNADGRCVVTLPVRINAAELPAAIDMLDVAHPYL